MRGGVVSAISSVPLSAGPGWAPGAGGAGAAGAGGGAGAGGALLPAPTGPVPASRTAKTSNPAWIRRTVSIVAIVVSDGVEAPPGDMLETM